MDEVTSSNVSNINPDGNRTIIILSISIFFTQKRDRNIHKRFNSDVSTFHLRPDKISTLIVLYFHSLYSINEFNTQENTVLFKQVYNITTYTTRKLIGVKRFR